jgi:purine-binding chemotaxis protein CheW
MPDQTDQAGAEAEVPLEQRERFVICMVLDGYYALPARFVSEITLFDKVYPLPLLPVSILGIINRYSTPFVLLDTGLLIAGRPGRRSKILVLKEPEGLESSNLEKTAFLIDDVIDIVEIPGAELLPLEKGDAVESSFSWKGRDVLVLDVRGLVNRAAGEAAA